MRFLAEQQELLALILCTLDLAVYAEMAWLNIYYPMHYVLGVLFPSLGAYVIGAWLFKRKSRASR